MNIMDISLSRKGQILSVGWITVTSVPSLAYTDPISRPITPAPTTIIFFGIFGSSSAPVEVQTYLSSISRTPGGRLDGSLPVAIIMFLALMVDYFPSTPSTPISVAELNLPQPFT